ncbi:MAG: hypothetical protein ACQGVC_11565 [Myxococcota bacterium]
MDRELYFIADRGCYVVRWMADVSDGSATRHWQELIGNARFRPGLAALHDVRGHAIELGRQSLRDEAEAYRAEVEPRVGFGRVAILVDDPEMHRRAERLVRMLELHGARVTFSETEAKEWVGLPPDQPLPYASPPG